MKSMKSFIQSMRRLKGITPWSIALFALLALIIFLPALSEYRSSRNELIRIWLDQGRLLSEIILRSGRNIMDFDEEARQTHCERLLDVGKFIRQIDSLNFPQQAQLMHFTRTRLQGFLLFFDGQGNPQPLTWRRRAEMFAPLQQQIGQMIRSAPPDKNVTILSDCFDAPLPQMVVLVRRAFIPAYIAFVQDGRPMQHQAHMQRLRQWLDQIAVSHSITFVQLFKDEHVIAHSGSLAPEQIPALSNQIQLPFNWRLVMIENRQIFEYLHRLPDGLTVRIGLSSSALDTLRSNLRRRLLLNSFILLAIGSVMTVYILKRQNYVLLSGKYRQIQTMTGSILENMSDGIFVLNEQQEVVIFNSAAAEFFQRSPEALSGRNLKEIDLPFTPEIQSAINFLQPIYEAPLVVQKDSKKLNLLLTAARLRYHTGQDKQKDELLYIILLRDYTSQKELEEFRSRKSKLLAMGQLASRVAHEVRNPLNSIGVIAQRLQREFIPQKDADDYRQLTQAVRQETGRINAIIENFLLYARAPELKLEQVNLTEIIQDLQPVIAALGCAEIHYSLNEHCPALVDRDQIKQVVINLVKNALEASPGKAKINISLQCNSEKIIFSLADNGQGLPEEIKDKIFDLYFTTKPQGSGIGLSIVEKIVSAHGGRVWVESPYWQDGQETKGACFYLEFKQMNGVLE